jgi:hypothetical protein
MDRVRKLNISENLDMAKASFCLSGRSNMFTETLTEAILAVTNIDNVILIVFSSLANNYHIQVPRAVSRIFCNWRAVRYAFRNSKLYRFPEMLDTRMEMSCKLHFYSKKHFLLISRNDV